MTARILGRKLRINEGVIMELQAGSRVMTMHDETHIDRCAR